MYPHERLAVAPAIIYFFMPELPTEVRVNIANRKSTTTAKFCTDFCVKLVPLRRRFTRGNMCLSLVALVIERSCRWSTKCAIQHITSRKYLQYAKKGGCEAWIFAILVSALCVLSCLYLFELKPSAKWHCISARFEKKNNLLARSLPCPITPLSRLLNRLLNRSAPYHFLEFIAGLDFEDFHWLLKTTSSFSLDAKINNTPGCNVEVRLQRT